MPTQQLALAQIMAACRVRLSDEFLSGFRAQLSEYISQCECIGVCIRDSKSCHAHSLLTAPVSAEPWQFIFCRVIASLELVTERGMFHKLYLPLG